MGNFLLRHEPVLTYDVDLWIDDTAENGRRCEMALAALGAEWARTDTHWGFEECQRIVCLLLRARDVCRWALSPSADCSDT
jgi:hypothetical protein